MGSQSRRAGLRSDPETIYVEGVPLQRPDCGTRHEITTRDEARIRPWNSSGAPQLAEQMESGSLATLVPLSDSEIKPRQWHAAWGACWLVWSRNRSERSGVRIPKASGHSAAKIEGQERRAEPRMEQAKEIKATKKVLNSHTEQLPQNDTPLRILIHLPHVLVVRLGALADGDEHASGRGELVDERLRWRGSWGCCADVDECVGCVWRVSCGQGVRKCNGGKI